MTATTVSLRSLITSTLAARWRDASDAVREWALARGYARVPEFSAECADAEDWRDDWREPNGGSWPIYTLTISVDGRTVGDVQGWHYVGPWSGHCDGQPEDWTTRSWDGAYSGLPRVVWEDDDAGPHVTCEPDGSLNLPRVGEDGRVLVYDADRHSDPMDAIRDAASDADHGAPPSPAELDPADADREPWARVYVIRGYRVVVAAEVRRITAYQIGTEIIGRGREKRRYLLSGYVVVDDDGYPLGGVCEDADDAISSADPTGERYLSDCDAEHALEELVRERLEKLDTPEGLSWDFDGIGLYVQPDGSSEEKYHLDAEQTATVCLRGWYAVWNEILSAFSVRETLAARREWSERMDALIAERDPFVGLEDSLSAGNCLAESERFARAVCESEGGEVGAVRASRILAMRDDAYTRRACRMAAQRVAGAE